MDTAALLSTFDQQNWAYLLPEIFMTVGLLVVLVLNLVTNKKTEAENRSLAAIATLFTVLALSALSWVMTQKLPVTLAPQSVMYGSLTADLFGNLMRVVILVGAILSMAISGQFLQQRTRVVGDFYVLIMGATLGGMFLASANDLIMVFVGLETLSITSYILAGYLRKTAKSAEASLKYLVYGGMGTAVFLFGLSMIYGLTGSTNLHDIASAMMQYHTLDHPAIFLMLLMTLAALAFKLSVAPFHMWTPDVYDGAPTPVAAFLSVVSKTAAFAVTIRLMVMVFAGFYQWTTLLAILAVLSMTIGNFVALKQSNVKRLLAYSTISHAGYMLLGLLIGTAVSMGSLVFYLITYVFMNIGAFASVIYFSNLTHSDEISAYQGLVQKQPGLTLSFSLCLLSLAGIPITAGFFAKFFLFQAVAYSGPGMLWLVIIALLNSAVSLAYYINIIRMMVVKEPSKQVEAIPANAGASFMLSGAVSCCVLLTLLLGIFASSFLRFSTDAIDQLIHERPQPTVSQATP